MPTFKYSARDVGGVSVRGELEAASRKAALQKLVSQKLRPVSVSEFSMEGKSSTGAGQAGFWTKLSALSSSQKKPPLSRKLALPFLVNLKELLACGVQTGDALQLLSQRLVDPGQKRLAVRLWDDLRQGRSLSEALRKQASVFSDSEVSLVEAGEATGNLSSVLGRMVLDLEESNRIKSKLSAALAYPLFLMVIAFGLVLLFLFFLLPRIQGLLTSLGSNLPWSTRLLIGMAEWALAYGWLVALGVAVAAAGTVSWRKTPQGRPTFDEFILRVPLLGRFLRDLQVMRLTQVLSLLLENGITMVQALSMTERSLSNYAMRERFSEARSRVVEGATLSSAFRSTGYFDGMALDIFTVGENTGNIVPGLKQMARQYNERVDAAIKAFLGIVSVGVLLFVFVFVGLVAMGIISAVFQMSASMGG